MIRRIAVLGAGTMGHGIAHAAIAAGYDTRLYDVSADAIDSGRASIETIVGRGVDLGKISAAEADATNRHTAAKYAVLIQSSLRALRWSSRKRTHLDPNAIAATSAQARRRTAIEFPANSRALDSR
jgi:3-hydroxyisobutyrate dehydrogenase-like beta-hydroxyacid dehydrogenase